MHILMEEVGEPIPVVDKKRSWELVDVSSETGWVHLGQSIPGPLR